MEAEQTIALYGKGEAAWNDWARTMLARKDELEAAGSWLADWFGEGQNPQTQDWLAEARADFAGHAFAGDAGLQNFVFPGPALFDGAHFRGRAQFVGARFAHTARFQNTRFDADAAFKQAQFHHLTVFDDAVFAAAGDFEKAEFLRTSTGPLAPAARFQKTQFKSRAEFRGSRFTGHAEFVRAQFAANARFDEIEFLADANFEGAAFEGTAGLVKARFHGAAKFDKVRFDADARFGEAQFKGPAGFEETSFGGKSSFRMAAFGGETRFDSADFETDTRFTEAQFAAPAHFRKTSFDGIAEFQKIAFAGPVEFASAYFAGEADFAGARFAGDADFTGARFKSCANFSESQFQGGVNFFQASFKGRASFRSADFAESAGFEALESRGAFVLSGSRFAQVPNFQEATLREAPSLDDIAVADPMRIFPKRSAATRRDPRPFFLRTMKACGGGDISARYRRLKQFAALTSDTEREREFFAQELRARRFFFDKPFGRGFGRFWFGWLYGGVSDFGRSFGRPLLAWTMSVPLFALAYLTARGDGGAQPAVAPVPSHGPALPAFPQEASAQTVLDWLTAALLWAMAKIKLAFNSGACVAGDSSATAEAFFLSVKNSFFFLGWESQDAARRVYSCLYGYDPATGTDAVRIPLAVSSTAIAQNIVSALLLFLVLIAFRNLLKTR